MTVLLVEAASGDVNLHDGVVSKLAKLGVTNVSLLRNGATVAIVLEGWLFDPARSAAAAAAAIGTDGAVTSFEPVLHVGVAAPMSSRPVSKEEQTVGKSRLSHRSGRS